MGWVVNAMPNPLTPRNDLVPTMGGWLGPRAGLDGCVKLAPTEIRSPDRPTSSELLYGCAIPVL
jgi:hypothetical protein